MTTAFEQWYNGMVGFHINSERILEDLNNPLDYNQTVNPETVRKWMAVCWNEAIEAAQNEDAVTFDLHAYDVLESLKEKI